MKGRDFYYNPSTNEMELVSNPSPLRPEQPTLPGFKNLPVTKPKSEEPYKYESWAESSKLKDAELLVAKANKKTTKQLTDLKHWAQPETRKELSTGGYIDKEQRIYEALKVPGYETPEKSNVSYKKLKQKEKGTYPFDTPQGIDHVTKIMKEEADHKLSSKENKDIDILNKEMKLSVLKDEIGGLKKFDNLDRSSYPSDPEQRRRLKNIDKLEKSLGYKSPEINIPYKKDTRTPNEKKRQNYNIEKRLKNARGPSTWSLITKHADTWQDKQQIREIVNKNYKRDPTSIAPEDRKWLDKDLVEPVKITDYPEIVLGAPQSNPQITVNTKPVEQIVKELADERLVHEQRDWDRQYGRSGIAGLKRPE